MKFSATEETNYPSRLLKLQRTFLYLFYTSVPRKLRTKENIFFLCFSSSALFFLLFLIGPVLWVINQERSSISAFICSFFIFISMIMWKRGSSLVLVHLIYQGSLLGVILYNAYYLGGVTSSVMVWMGLVPILPIFLMSREWGYGWLVGSIAIVLGMLQLQINGHIPMRLGDTIDDLYLSTLMIGMLSLTQMILVSTYDTASWTMFQQITKKNEALQALSRKLEIASSHKDTFLATVSHEMRTPLNAIFGFLNIIERTDHLPSEVYGFVKHAKNSSSHLLTVINDLLDFSQMQQGRLVLAPQVVHLKQTVYQIHAALQSRAAEKDLKYSLEFIGEIPQYVKLDPHRLTQILLNLLGNAVKFTNQGGVRTEIRVFSAVDVKHNNDVTLEIVVSDTGIGISEHQIGKVFEPFVQIKEQDHIESDYSLRGNGLGLSITRSLVLLQGGVIDVQSKKGEGSAFRVCLPVHVEQAPNSLRDKSEPSVNPIEINLLVVDDHQMNRMVVSNLVKKFFPNATITEAKNGTEALTKMRSELFDLVLMDLIMPDLTGTEVVEIIRKEAAPYSDVNVVALTANFANEALHECNRVHMQGVLPKPIDLGLLVQTITQFGTPKDLKEIH